MVSETEVSDLAEAYGRAWAAHDADAVVALHTDDSVFHVHGLADPAVGTDSVRGLVAEFFAQVPDLRFEHKRVYVAADHIAFEYDMTGTAGGSRFVCDGVDVIAIRAGRVARKDTYLDLVSLARQIGGLPQMSADAATAATMIHSEQRRSS
jgi:steroid delta-isomerase-like uncharacterized protein